MGRSPCCTKEGVRRGAWTPMEDTILTHYISLHGEGSWRNLPQMAGLKRCGKSCRLRWLNYLRPDIKRGNITPDEEELIIRLHRLLGNRWSLIAGRLPGRTDNEIKNYWNSTLSRRLQLHRQHKTKRSRKIKTMINKSPVNTRGDPDPEKKESGRAVRTKAVKWTKAFYNPPPVAGVEDPGGLMGNMPVGDFGGDQLGSFSEFFMESLSNEGDEGSPASQLEEPIVFSDEMVEDWRKSSCPLDASLVDYWLGV